MLIFSRATSITVNDDMPGMLRVTGNLNDRYHEMQVVMDFKREDLELIAIEGQIIRARVNFCRFALERLTELIGVHAGRGFRTKVLHRLGGPNGCTHMTNMILECANVTFFAIRIEDYEEWKRPFAEEHRHEVLLEGKRNWFKRYPQMVDACIAWRKE